MKRHLTCSVPSWALAQFICFKLAMLALISKWSRMGISDLTCLCEGQDRFVVVHGDFHHLHSWIAVAPFESEVGKNGGSIFRLILNEGYHREGIESEKLTENFEV